MLRALLLTLAVMIAGLPALAVPTDEMFEKLWTADQNGWIMGAGTDGVDESTAEGGIDEGGGLVDGHAYSVIAVYKNDDTGAKILRIRNPWGKVGRT